MTRVERRTLREQSGPCLVYILRLKRPSPTGQWYYVGITQKPLRRWTEHALPGKKSSAIAVKASGMEEVVCTRWYSSRQTALEAEEQTAKRIEYGWEPTEDMCTYITPFALRLRQRAAREGVPFQEIIERLL